MGKNGKKRGKMWRKWRKNGVRSGVRGEKRMVCKNSGGEMKSESKNGRRKWEIGSKKEERDLKKVGNNNKYGEMDPKN